MLVFSGSSNQPLAKKIALSLKTRLGKVELSRFPNDEARVYIKEKDPGERAVLVQSLSQPTDKYLVELMLIGDALVRLGVKKIILVIPWFGYSKQDKVFRPGEPLSAQMIARILQLLPLEKVITYDLHSPKISRFFKCKVMNMSGRRLFNNYFKPRVDKQTIIIAPDKGSRDSIKRFSMDLKLPVACIDKERSLVTGKIMVKGIDKPVKGLKTLVKDDMIATGDTIIAAAELLKKEKAARIEVCATHHLFINQVQAKLDKSPIDCLWITDTVKKKGKSKKLIILSVAERIAWAIRT
ncbi:MAG: ribose-phosphate pyrophosphokinase [Candidatus Beckwithbacteria bacterium]